MIVTLPILDSPVLSVFFLVLAVFSVYWVAKFVVTLVLGG